MKFQRVSALAKKELKKTFREPAVLFMIFIFPIVFVLAFGASFGCLGSGQPTYAIGVVNLDQTNTANHTQSFINALLNMEILSIRVYADNQTAQIDLSQGKTQAVIVIPGTFSQSLASYQAAPENPSLWVNSTVLIYVDKGSITATQAVPPIIQQVLNALADQTAQQDLTLISMQIASLVETKPLSTFEFMAPGMFTFASIFISCTGIHTRSRKWHDEKNTDNHNNSSGVYDKPNPVIHAYSSNSSSNRLPQPMSWDSGRT